MCRLATFCQFCHCLLAASSAPQAAAPGPGLSLHCAGEPPLLVSLWPVADESTERLMTRCYEALGKSDARMALRQAQLDVMREPKFSHPFFWAPFDLVGDWR